MSTATTIPARREALEGKPSRGMASLARQWFATLWRFLLGQGLTQFLALGTGLLLVWFLPKEQYAQYSVAFAFQATMSALVDLGMVSSIVALVGDRGHKPEVIGRYLASGQRLRGFLFLIVAVGVVVLFPLLTMKHGWPVLTLAGLMLGVIAFVYCQRLMMYAAPLLIHDRLQSYYRAQLLGAGIKLSGVVLLWLVGLLDAITAVWVSVLAIVLHGMVFRHAAGPLVDQPPRSEPQTDREVRKVIGPLMPTVVFTAFQAHIAVFLITVFGNADAIADIGALGKLWQLFVLLNAFSLVVVQPRLARLKPGEVPVRYAQLVALLAVLVTGITLAAYAFPQPVLLLMGPKYHHLGFAVGPMTLAMSLNYLALAFLTMNHARKFLYWWTSWTKIGLVLATQAAAIVLLDLSTTLGVIYFMVATNGTLMLAVLMTGVYGMTKGREGAKHVV